MPVPGSPRPTFNFSVTIGDAPSSESASFQEISGIGMEVTSVHARLTDESQLVFRVPGAARPGTLTMKRGIISSDAPIARWCHDALESGLGTPISPKQLHVSLLGERGDAVRSWVCTGAYPISWHVSPQLMAKTEVAIESIEFAYAKIELQER